MTITISDIIYLNDAIKSLKQKNVMWIHDKIFGIDNFSYIIYTKLNLEKISKLPTTGFIFNQRELSKFVKSLTTESTFELDENSDSTILITISETLVVKTSRQIESTVIGMSKNAISIDCRMLNITEDDCSKDLEKLYTLNKTSGSFLYKYDNNHLLTLFSGIVPLAKADKLYIKVMDNSDNTFLARFRSHKKHFDVFIYLLYLKI